MTNFVDMTGTLKNLRNHQPLLRKATTKFFFFDSFTYDLLFKQTEGKNISKERVESVLGKELYKDFVKARSC